MVRSVLEGVAFSLRDAFDAISPLASTTEFLVTGGGAKSELWLQILADVLNSQLLKPKQNQGAAYGAAALAWQGLGAIDKASELGDKKIGQVITPKNAAEYKNAYAGFKTIY